MVSPPDGDGAFGGEAPDHDPAICVTGYEARVRSDEACRVDLSGMAPEDVGWLGRRKRHYCSRIALA